MLPSIENARASVLRARVRFGGAAEGPDQPQVV
jgi:hypothetical protein